MKKGLLVSLVLGLLVLMAAPAWAEGNFGVRVLGGYAFPTAGGDAMMGRDGYSGPEDSDFKNNWTAGIEGLYAFSGGLQLGIGVQYLPLTAEASRSAGGTKEDFLTLKSTAIYALARYQYPVQTGFTGHFEAGLGYNMTSVDNEQAINAMGSSLGASLDTDTENAVMALIGAGVDYYFNPALSLGLSARYWWSEVDYTVTASGYGDIIKGELDAHNIQAVISLSYWFGK